MYLLNRSRRLAPPVLAFLGIAAMLACQDRSIAPTAPEARASIKVGLSVSSHLAAVGENVVVAVDLDRVAGVQLGGLQGTLHYDAGRLEYLGEDVGRTIVAVNDKDAARGLLQVASLDAEGLPEHTALLLFRVRGDGYEHGLRYEFAKAASNGVVQSVTQATVRPGIGLNPSLSIESARRMSLQDWMKEAGVRLGKPAQPISQRPGQYHPGWLWGDATLDNAVDIVDAVFMINASVNVAGTEILLGTAEPTNRDAALAGNVVPYNNNATLPGGAPNPQFGHPGVEQDGSRLADIADAVGIINQFVFGNQPVVGTVISTRGDSLAGCTVTHSQDANGGYIHTQTWHANEIHCLDGLIRVDSGQVLTIDPGTTVKGQFNRPSALFIMRDGKIMAAGTETQPITFTCTQAVPFKGCWSGLVISGWAPTNFGTLTSPGSLVGRDGMTGCRENQGEGGAPKYGGCNPDDNSGVLQYVRVLYGGFILSPDNELNGITLYGVGRGTTIDHVQSMAGLDDGMEFFGGTVNVKYVYLNANSDDNFDITDGWNGSAQFVVIQADSSDADKGLEADNQGTVDFTAGADNSPSAPPGLTNPYTHPNLWNFTYVGRRDPTHCPVGANPANCGNDAMHIRRGTAPTIRNWLVYSAPRALNIDDAATCSNLPRFSIRYTIIARIPQLGNPDADADGTGCGVTTSGTTLEEQYLATEATVHVVPPGIAADTLMQGPFEVRTPDFRPRAAALVAGAAPASEIPAGNTFLQQVNYIGAVEPANLAKTNIPWYATWTVGWRTATTP